MKPIKKRILETAEHSGKKGISYRELLIKSKLTAREQAEFPEAVRELKNTGRLVEKKRRLYANKAAGLHPAVITRINKTFGFAVLADNDQEIFIPEEDQEHPSEICGRDWYYYEDDNSRPYLTGL